MLASAAAVWWTQAESCVQVKVNQMMRLARAAAGIPDHLLEDCFILIDSVTWQAWHRL